MKRINYVALLATSLVVGCKSHLTADVNVTDLTSNTIKNTTATLYAEVASCNSYEDSRNPSSALIEAKQVIPSLFANAQFENCFQQKMESFAQFSIPLMVGHMSKDEDFKPNVIKVFSQVENELLLGVHMPKAMKASFEQHNKQDFQVNSITPESVFITIGLINDTDKNFPFDISEGFLDEKPNPPAGSKLSLPPKGRVEIRLSNVDTARLLLPTEHGGQGIVMLGYVPRVSE